VYCLLDCLFSIWPFHFHALISKERHYLYTQENYHFTNIFFNNCKVIYAVIHKVWLFITYFLCVFVCCLCLCILLMLLYCLSNWACLLCQHINNKKLSWIIIIIIIIISTAWIKLGIRMTLCDEKKICRILYCTLPYTSVYQTVQAQSTQICGPQIRLILNICAGPGVA
jgi:hypothetical protein